MTTLSLSSQIPYPNSQTSIKPFALPKLLREYNSQARDNFATEAMLFTIIVLTGLVWPTIEIVRALLQ